ncbi:MAG: FlgD immunoglobulin-like domain containing protein, partial [Fibrobacteria bacterium]
LLGDPALGMSFPRREGGLALAPRVLAGGASLEAKGTGLAVAEGGAVATVLLGDSTESNTALKVSGSSLTLAKTFAPKPEGIQNGKVLVHYWNDKQTGVMSAPFSSSDWLIDSVAIEPANAAPGDSVRLSILLNTAYAKISVTGGAAFWVVGGATAPLFPLENQSALVTEDGGLHLHTNGKVLLEVPAGDLAGPHVYLGFRIIAQVLDDQGERVKTITDLASRTYSLPLSELPRLELPVRAIHLPIQDKLGVWVLFHNKGIGAAQGFKVSLTRDAESQVPVTDTLPYAGKLGSGRLDSLFFSLADSMLQGRRMRASLIPSRDGELAVAGGSRDSVFRMTSRRLSASEDTLWLDSLRNFLALPGSGADPRRVYAETVSVASLPPHLAPAQGTPPFKAFRILAADLKAGALVFGRLPDSNGLPKVSAAATSADASSAAAAATAPAWHFRALDGQAWVKLDTLTAPENTRLGKGFTEGLYALLVNRDASPPLIQLSSRGQALLMDDYVPTRTPIDVVIRDGEGVDLSLHPPDLASRSQSLDSANHAQDAGNAFPTLARLHFIPDGKALRDSITITARDISGNTATRTLVYRMGDELNIRNLGSYPNPFADTAVFVYSLTDYCDRVDLKVYSRAGRLVRNLEQRNVVGYQEVLWDGRSGSGNNVANGLYFLKVTAKAGSKESTRIFKLFKKQRK